MLMCRKGWPEITCFTAVAVVIGATLAGSAGASPSPMTSAGIFHVAHPYGTARPTGGMLVDVAVNANERLAVPAQACPEGSLSQTTDCTPAQMGGVPVCGWSANFNATTENSYYRRFPLNPSQAGGVITGVLVGIGYAIAEDGRGFSGSVRLYAIDRGEPLQVENLSLMAEAGFDVPNQTNLTSLTVPILAAMPDPQQMDLVVELFQPDLTGAGINLFFSFGANATGTAPTYIRAPACGYPQPTPMAEYAGGYPDWAVIAAILGIGIADQIYADGFEL